MRFEKASGAEFREVREIDHEGQPARAVEGSRLYRTGIDDLWDALTNPERLSRWFLPIRGELRLGGRYSLEGNAEGTITRCDPPEVLEVTWEYADNVSWVSVRLEPENDGARLHLTHTMLKDETSEAHWQTYGPGATGVGWDLSFLGLGLYLDGGGDALDREATDAWLASEAGRSFVHGCAESWGQAHAAAGEETALAQAMAARTASFFAGDG